MNFQGRARIVGRDEEENVMELCRALHQENGIFTMNEEKVRNMLNLAFDKKGGILAGIGEKGKLEGLVFIYLSSFWYSDDPFWEELFLFVLPEYRKSTNAVELLKFGKWCTEETGFPLFIGIMSDSATARKERLYERQLSEDSYKGRLFMYKKNKK
jgi:hypothetical protein